MQLLPADATTAKAGHIRYVALASMIGTTIEWYDFFLYGTAAALVFNRTGFNEPISRPKTMNQSTSYTLFGRSMRTLGRTN